MPFDPSRYLTVADIIKHLDSEGKYVEAVDLSRQFNPLIPEMAWTPGNDGNSHIIIHDKDNTIEVARNRSNRGDKPSKSVVETLREEFTTAVGLAEVEEKTLDRVKNSEQVVARQAYKAMEKMNEKFVLDIIYGRRKDDPEGIDGLATRAGKLNSLASRSKLLPLVDTPAGTTAAPHATATATSIYVIKHGPGGVHAWYPEVGKMAGINVKQWKDARREDSNGDVSFVTGSRFSWMYGLALEAPNALARLGGIPHDSTWLYTEANFKTVENKLLELLNAVQLGTGEGRVVMYMAPLLYTAFQVRVKDKGNLNLDLKDAFGQPVLGFNNAIVRQMEGIKVDEFVANQVTSHASNLWPISS